jgi:hypothetical protein
LDMTSPGLDAQRRRDTSGGEAACLLRRPSADGSLKP